MRHRASWPPPQGLPVQDKLSLPQRPASHPSVMTRPSAAPSVSLVATPGLTENLRETGICLGRQKAQVGGAGCQPCQYDEGAPRGHEPSDERKGLAAARREPAGVVEVDQQETARGIAGKPTGCDARFALNDLSPTPGILQAGGRAAVRVRRRLGIPERIFGLCDGRKRQKGSTQTC